MRPRAIMLIGAVALALAGAGWWANARQEQQRQVVFTIPAGTAERVAAGARIDVLPTTIELERGARDVLVIRNEDTQPIQVGPYLIAPGQRFVQRYQSRGTFDLLCSIHPGERMRVVVR